MNLLAVFGMVKEFAVAIFKDWKLILMVVAVTYGYGEWKDSRGYDRGVADMKRAIALAQPDTSTESKPDTSYIHDTTYIKIRGDVILVSDTSDRMTIAQLREAVQPFKITKGITVTDDKKKVGVSFDASFEAYPIGHTIHNLRFSNIRSTYPKETVTVTKTVIEPAHQHFMDLYVKADIGGIFNHPFMHDMAGMMSTGVEVNIGAVQLNAGIGPAFQLSKVTGLYTFGLKVSTR